MHAMSPGARQLSEGLVEVLLLFSAVSFPLLESKSFLDSIFGYTIRVFHEQLALESVRSPVGTILNSRRYTPILFLRIIIHYHELWVSINTFNKAAYKNVIVDRLIECFVYFKHIDT